MDGLDSNEYMDELGVGSMSQQAYMSGASGGFPTTFDSIFPHHQASDLLGPQVDRRRRGKIFNDSIHGHIWLHPNYLDFIDSSPFQRLRDLNQLGCTYMVRAGAKMIGLGFGFP